jgi:hypothetical protein
MKSVCIIFLCAFFTPSMLHAQVSGTGASGQYCATYSDDASPEDCSFSTFEMCEQSISGIGGSCAPQSEAPAMPPPPLFHFFQTPVAPAAVPPPFANQPVPPPPTLLPDAPPNGN